MLRSRLFYVLMGLFLVMTLATGFSAAVVSADTTTTTPTDTPTPTPPLPVELKLTCDVPSYSDNSGVSFNYNVNMTYSGTDTIMVALSLVNPAGWTSYLTYTSKEVTSLPIGPLAFGSPDSKSLSITFSPTNGASPNPGDYKMTVKATSGQFNASIDLDAIVKAKYDMLISTPSGKLNTTATTGKDNHFLFQVQDSGSAELDSISLSADYPTGWTVKFSPDTIAKLTAGQTQPVDATITPPNGQTVAGDYMLTFHSNNSNVSRSMDIRITVNTPSIWGIVSIIIIVVVIIGLAVLFLRLGRR
jgi:uncharacterized membrane protein